MKICVFSDIHGNGPAFRVAYKMIVSEEADMNIFLGDLCGYYYDQIEIFDMLREIRWLIAIKGNHDLMFLHIVNDDKELRHTYLAKYGYSIENLLAEDNQELVQWVSTLPDSFSLSDLDIACYHGSPWSNLEGYVYPDSSLDKFNDYPASIFILGHTHYPMVRMIEDKLVVNPGSLGQPRNDGWPSYAVIEFPSKRVVLKEVPYNKAEFLRRIDELDSKNKYLKKILYG